MGTTFDATARARAALQGFEPYDPAFTPSRINLSANENSYPLPEAYYAAIHEAMVAMPLNRYPDPMSNELRAALAERHSVDPKAIMVGNGGDELLFNLLFTFGGAGHALVTCPPDFAEYANFAKMTETPCVFVERDPEDFSINAQALLKAASEASIVILTSPNNPTGNLLDHALVRRLLDETDALLLVDEAYVDFSGEEASVVSWVADEPRLMVLRTFSKAFGLAGLRCGYLVADPSVVDMLGAIRQIYSVDVLAQCVALAAVRNRELVAPIVSTIVKERARLASSLSGIEGVTVWPSAANFVLVRMAGASTVRARLRDEHSILVRDFSYAKGLADCLRITVGTPEENDSVVKALTTILKGE